MMTFYLLMNNYRRHLFMGKKKYFYHFIFFCYFTRIHGYRGSGAAPGWLVWGGKTTSGVQGGSALALGEALLKLTPFAYQNCEEAFREKVFNFVTGENNSQTEKIISGAKPKIKLCTQTHLTYLLLLRMYSIILEPFIHTPAILGYKMLHKLTNFYSTITYFWTNFCSNWGEILKMNHDFGPTCYFVWCIQ